MSNRYAKSSKNKNRNSKQQPIIKEPVSARSILCFCGIVTFMCALLFYMMDTRCIMAFMIRPSYPTPYSGFTLLMMSLYNYKIWQYVYIASCCFGAGALAVGIKSGRYRNCSKGLIVCFAFSILMAVLGFTRITYVTTLVLIPLAGMFTTELLAKCIFGYEIAFGVIALIFEKAGLLTGTESQAVDLMKFQYNYFGLWVFATVVIAWYLFGRNRNIISMIVVAAAAVVEWTVLECRTAAAIMVLFIPLIPLRSYVEKDRESGRHPVRSLVVGVFRLLPLIVFGFTAVAAVVLTKMANAGYDLDAAFRTRFVELIEYPEMYGLTAFGHDASLGYSGDIIFYLDNSYVKSICIDGVVPFVALMVFLLLINWRIAKRKDYGMMVLATLVYVYSMMEPVFCEPIFVLMAGMLLTRESNGEISEIGSPKMESSRLKKSGKSTGEAKDGAITETEEKK